MVTIHDVARAAGVSPMTVSNVLNGRTVRAVNRDRVVAAMDELGYRVNIAARSLRAGRTGTIGLAVAEVDRPYWGQLAERVIDAAAARDLRVLIEQTGAQREGELSALSESRNRMYDGLILSSVGLGPEDAARFRADYPIVLLSERELGGSVDHVAMANVEGGRLATEHLIARGCRRIATLDQHGDDASAEASSLRFAGHRAAVEAAGLGLDSRRNVRIDDLSMEAGHHWATSLIDSGTPFDGLFCVTDSVAIGAVRALADRGLRVPDDVKVIGFDDVRESRFHVPSLSSVDPDISAIAAAAVEMVVERIERGPEGVTLDHRSFVSPVRVVARESTGG